MCVIIWYWKNGQLLAVISIVSEKSLSQSVNNELKINLNGQLTKLVYTLTKATNGNGFDGGSIFWWLQPYCFHIPVAVIIPTTFSYQGIILFVRIRAEEREYAASFAAGVLRSSPPSEVQGQSPWKLLHFSQMNSWSSLKEIL